MDSRERRAAIDRDGFECQHCGTIDVLADDGGLQTHVVGPATRESATRHSLVTVCGDCSPWLADQGPEPAPTDADLFEAVQTLTRAQAGAVADVADFATAASAFPTGLESDVERTYPADRRALLLTLDVVDGRLEHVSSVDRAAFDPEVTAALEAFADEAGALQEQLRTVIGVAAVMASALERCHVCFDALADDRCSRCGTARLDVTDLCDADGAVRVDAISTVLGDALEKAGRLTDRVVDRTTVLAETLVG